MTYSLCNGAAMMHQRHMALHWDLSRLAIITRKNLLKDAANIAFLASEMPLARVSFL